MATSYAVFFRFDLLGTKKDDYLYFLAANQFFRQFYT